jgi:hypothetical protein
VFLAGYVYYLKRIQHLRWRQILTHAYRFAVTTFRYRMAKRATRPDCPTRNSR